MNIGSEYLDIDMGIVCIGMCEKCGEPVMENERMTRTEAGLLCGDCIGLQEENN